jgi:sulfoquinovosidase
MKYILTIAFVCCFYFSKAQDTDSLLKSEIKLGIIHPTVIANGYFPDTSRYISLDFKETKDAYIIKTNAFIFSIHKNPFKISLLNNARKELWNLDNVLFDGQKNTFTKIEKLYHLENDFNFTTDNKNISFNVEIVTENTVKFFISNIDNNSKNIELKFKAHGTFFGGGERFIGTVLNGRKFNNQPNDHGWLPDTMRTVAALQKFEPTYLPIPFIYTPKGTGLYVDDISTTTIDLQHVDETNFSVSINDNKTTVYFFAAASPKALLSAYTSLVGRTPLAPKWAFGVWLNLLKGADSVIYRANELRSLNIRSDVLWLFDFDDPESNTGWTLWTNGYYGNLRNLTDSLHKLNFKVLTYLRSFADSTLSYYNFPNPVYQFAKANNFILPSEKIEDKDFNNFHSNDQINFYNKAATDWWKNILYRNLITENFDGWMEDFGDVNYVLQRNKTYYTPLRFNLDMPFSDLSNEQVANLYPLLYHKITHQLAANLKPDVVEFSRSGSAASAAFEPIIWGGDQEPSWSKTYGYPSAISAGLSAGLSGYSVWAPDILCLSPSRELWMRWVEFGAMTSIMRDHLWNYGKANIRIWTDSSTLQFFKKYATLHEALKDYLYQTAKESTHTGVPVMRHLMLEYPNDTTTYHLEYEYMLGNDILVAPVVEEHATKEKIYLPEGKWKYYWTNKIYDGNVWINVDAPFSEIPFFINQDAKEAFTLPKPE